jgi:hypothetical protein
MFDTKEEEDAHFAKLEKQQEKASAPPPAPRRVVYHSEQPTCPHVGKVRTLKEIQAQQKPKEWIVDEFGVSGACVLLAADKGSGKTSLMYGMAAAIQNGETFMGQLTTQKRNVLIWQADESRDNLIDKFNTMGIDADIQLLMADEGFSNLDLSVLSQAVEELQIGVVFLDSVTTLLRGNGISMRDPEFADALYELNHWSSKHNVLTIISCHLRKPDESKKEREVNSDSIVGSGLQSAAVSDIWGMWKPTNPEFDQHFILKCLGKRNCAEGTVWNLQGSDEDFSWKLHSVGDENILPQRRQDLAFAFMQTLAEGEKRWHADELAVKHGSNKEHARRICRDLFNQHEIERHQLASTGGRKRWVYADRTFPTPE